MEPALWFLLWLVGLAFLAGIFRLAKLDRRPGKRGPRWLLLVALVSE
jgi:hypothetical protein